MIADGNDSEIEGFEDEECHEEEGIEAVPDQVAGQSYSDDAHTGIFIINATKSQNNKVKEMLLHLTT